MSEFPYQLELLGGGLKNAIDVVYTIDMVYTIYMVLSSKDEIMSS